MNDVLIWARRYDTRTTIFSPEGSVLNNFLNQNWNLVLTFEMS